MAVSLPHFLNTDPSLLKDVEGLKPDRKKHESFAILQQVNNIKYMKNSILFKTYVIHTNHKIKKLF